MDLYCMEANKLLQSYPDRALLDDDRILHNLLVSEEKYTISSSYFKCLQIEIKPYMRKVVAMWMLEVCEEEKCQEEVFPLAMNYLDRFLSIVRIYKSQLQLLGCVCLLLSSKLRQTPSIRAEKLRQYTDESVTIEEIRGWEILVLGRLKWDLCAITPNDFLHHIFRRMSLGDCGNTVRRHSLIFISLCAADFKFSMYPPSMIAAASLGAAVLGLSRQWTATELLEQLHRITGIEVDCLRECLEQIETMLQDRRNASQSGMEEGTDIREKNKMSAENCQDSPTSLAETPTDVQDVRL